MIWREDCGRSAVFYKVLFNDKAIFKSDNNRHYSENNLHWTRQVDHQKI